MPLKSLMAVVAMALLALPGCASTGANNNTTYAQYPSYAQDFGASDSGGVRIGF